MKSIPSQFNHSLRRVIPASLAAGILILASTAPMRAQSLILQMPNLIAEGTGTYPAAWIENPQIQTGGSSANLPFSPSRSPCPQLPRSRLAPAGTA